MSVSATTRFFAVAFSVLMLVSAAGAGVIGSVGIAQAQDSGDVVERVNAGGPSVSASSGPDWTADESGSTFSSGGSTYTATSLSAGDIDNPTDAPSEAFLTERYGDHSWSFDVSSGTEYEVRLYFAEIYHGVGTSSADTGDRVFDASIEGQQVLNDYDIVEETGGAATATVETFEVTPSDGTIDVSFATEVDNAKISAIEIVEATPEPGVLDGPDNVNFGTTVVGDSTTETVTLSNEGESGDQSITIDGASVSGTDADAFTTDFSGSVTLDPGETTDVSVTFSPSDTETKSASLEVSHDAENTTSPLMVDLAGEGVSDVPVGFSKSKLQGFSAGNPTAIDFGPDDHAYVSTQGGTVYALEVERTGEDSYEVVNEEQIDAIKDIPNHDDLGNLDAGESNRQITGLTVGGTDDQPVVYVSSSDPEIDVGQDDDDTDTNSGAISRLTFDWNDDGSLASVDHDVLVLGLPRSEENHATNGLDLSDDESTLYVAQGGHTNKGAPGDNFGHTPEYALSAAVLDVDLSQIESNYQAKSLQSENGDYPELDYYYSIPTVQGGDLPFGGNDGVNQAKIVPDGPVQIHSPGYRNPYDLVLSEDNQLYAIDNGPNGGWGGQPADSDGNTVSSQCTNHPNEDDSYGTGDQLHLATEGSYAGHAAPIRANPDDAGLYDADGNQYFDFNASNTPVPFDMANPVECDYQDPTEDNSIGPTFGWTGGITEYTASNFGGEMQGDLLVVENSNTVKRIQLNATGESVTEVSSPLSQSGALGITAQDDTEAFGGTVWTANHGNGDVTVFEPNDFGDNGDETCSGDYDASIDEDGDGYDNADEIDAGSDPCSAASTPPDFDDDGTSNLNDPDDDNDGIDDTEDLFAVGSDNGLDNDLPETYDFAPNSETGTILDLGFTGVMMNGSNYQNLYDPDEAIAGGAGNVLTVENVGQGDSFEDTNTQEHAYQVGVNADEPFTVESTVNGLPNDAEPFQSQGIFIGTGDQDNYTKLTATAFSDGDGSGVQLATEEGGAFTDVANPSAPTAGNETTLSMTVYPSNGTVEAYYAVDDGDEQFVDETTVPTSWFDTSDGNGTAVGVISTSNGASSTFDATWQNLYVEPLQEPANQAPIADAGADQTVDEGTTVELDASASSDPDDDSLSYDWTQTAGTSVSLTDADTATPSFTAPEVDADETLSFEVTVSDGESSDSDVVNVTVEDTDTATGDVVFAVNSGGEEYTATDGTVYVADTNFVNGSTYSVDSTTEIGNTDDDTLYQTERYGDPFEYDVPVENGTYEVTLKFAEIYQGVADSDSPDSSGPSDGTNENDRLFNASIEGDQVLTNYDIFAEVGPLNATDKTYTVEVTDGTLDIDFEATYDNAKISAIKVEDASSETLTIEEAVASYDETGDDTTIEFTEIQQAINWWQTGAEVPGTDGKTIDFQTIQELINLWQTDATIGGGNSAPSIDAISDQSVTENESVDVSVSASDADDDSLSLSLEQAPDFVSLTDNGDGTGTVTIAPEDGDAANSPYTVEVLANDGTDTDSESFTVTVTEPSATEGSAELLVTPDSGLEASTYNGGSFQLTNTGEEDLTTVTLDLSSTSMPDMVWDPEGTAGDQAAKGLSIDSQSGDGVGVVSTADADVFSQPHNGVNDSDGYDVLTIEFTDFDPGETVTFSADNDPTSIKDAQVSSQEAGPVSGLELSRATFTVGYDDGTTQTTQTIGDGSQGGAEAVADESVPTAPNIDAAGVTLDSGVLDGYHSAATVTDASQTITVSGPAGESVTLLQIEGELELDNVPEYDGSPGYDIEEYEANKAENVDYYTATIGSDGTVDIPVTLTNSTDVGGFNYFTAAVEDGEGPGMGSNVVVLQYAPDSDTGTTDQPVYAVNAGGDAYTAVDGTEYAADANFDQFEDTNDVSQAIGNTEDDTLYQTERYGDPLSYGFPVDDGTYDITLQFAEIYHGVDGANPGGGEGDRVFNVSVEGQEVLTDYDIYEEVGALNATDETFTVEVTDGSLDVSMDASTDYAKVSAIKIENASDSGDTNTAPTIDSISDQTVTEGETAQVAVNASDADGDALTLSADGPSFVNLTDNGDGTGTLDIAPESGEAGSYTVNVTADDGQATATESFQLTVEEATTSPQALHRVNAGESTTLSALDDGPDWTGVEGTDSEYLVSVADSDEGNYCGGDNITPDSTVPSSTPDAVFDCERYGNSTWEFSVGDGQEVEVRLYLGNQYDGTSEPEQRQYNVSIEGDQVLTNYDPVADVGHANGTMKSFTAPEDGDGTITISFDQGAVQNPQVNAIEIVESEESTE